MGRIGLDKDKRMEAFDYCRLNANNIPVAMVVLTGAYDNTLKK